MMGAQELGSACLTITFQGGTPFRRAISMYGEASRLMMAARVMRIMCATTTSTMVNAGRKVRYSLSARLMSSEIFAMAGK